MGKDSLYEAMKTAAKKRKIKSSPQHDLYKRVDPYFLHTFYTFDTRHPLDKVTGKIGIILDIAVKYCRFDELRWGIISPGSDLKFTDKVRANSLAMCYASLIRRPILFDCDDSENGLDRLCGDILDWIEQFYQDFFASVKKEHGSLEEYYLAHREDYPLLAGLVHIERGQYLEAGECFRLPNMHGRHNCTSIKPVTEEQLARVKASCERSYLRNDCERLLDYTIAMQHGVEWTEETARYGLLPEERQGALS